MSSLSFAVCSYNRARRLEKLIPAMRAQSCPVPFEILVVDNNSNDDTRRVVEEQAARRGPNVRYVFEPEQGITYARNRAIGETLDKDFLVFIDDDELPGPGLLEAAVDALEGEGAACAGGRVEVVFPPGRRPSWLDDELLGFLAGIDYGDEALWIEDKKTPLWTANIAFRTDIFKQDRTLRFDSRYNRRGHQIGGGSDAVMFWSLLQRGVRIRYRPDMMVEHFVEEWRLRRSYFLKLHFVAGRKFGQFETPDYPRTLFGIPAFMLKQTLRHWGKTLMMLAGRRPGALRQAMNGAHATGTLWGRYLRWKDGN